MQHITVLAQEAVDDLDLSTDSTVVDATLGAGGHARYALSKLGKDGRLIGLDVDPTAILQNQSLSSSYDAGVELFTTNFQDIHLILDQLEISCVNGIVADLGWRMEQFDGSSGTPRGFSFNRAEPLLMTFGDPKEYAVTAASIVNEWGEVDIANVLFGYGEETFSRRIAKAIIEARDEAPIEDSKRLADIIYDAVPNFYRKRKTHPATRSFQALRIAVNDEFSVLETFMERAIDSLCSGGRLAIITFHSLEDRIVKQRFKALAADGVVKLVRKKPLAPSDQEQQQNPRARSAKLRTIEKL